MAGPWNKESLCQAIKQDPNFCLKCPSLANEIVARRLDLYRLVEYLKDLLTDPEPSQRAQGLLVLATVLRALPLGYLQEHELQFIVKFFCDRLKDHHDVIPAALKGIHSIMRMKNLDKELPSEILKSLMQNITCQSQRQEDRLVIYRILDALVIPHLDELKGLGPDLVYHIISSIDGERDPRNLGFLFSMLPPILKRLPLGHLTEDFFETLACYFPVDFRPAASDPNSVSREYLATGLSECLTAIPTFSEFCIPLLLDKLNSALPVAKVDSLDVLKKGCKVFPPQDMAVHLSPLWMSLSREALSGSNYEIRQAAREAVTDLMRCLAELPSGTVRQSDPMRQLLGDVISASVSALTEAQTSLFLPASELLRAAANSSSVACENVFSKVFPLLMDNFNGKQELTDKSIYLRTMSRFLTVCMEQEVTPQSIADIAILWSSIVQLFFHATEHEASLVRKEALFGLTILAPTLNSDERLNLYSFLCNVIDGEDFQEAREQCKECLMEIAKNHAAEISTHILFERLKLSGVQKEDVRFERRLEILCCLAALEPFSQEILPNVIDSIVLSNDKSQIRATLSFLRKLLKTSEEHNKFVFECLNGQCDMVTRLVAWWIAIIQRKDGVGASFLRDEDLLREVCDVISVVVTNLQRREQESLVHTIMIQFYPGSESFRPCDITSPTETLLVVALLESILGCLYPDVIVTINRDLCYSLAEMAVHSENETVTVSSSRLCASLLNKELRVTILEGILADVSALISNSLAGNIESRAVQAVHLHAWITRGLAMRGYKGLDHWIDKMIDLLEDPRKLIAKTAAESFATVMTSGHFYVSPQTHCTFSLLYRQRVFMCALKLIEPSRNASMGRLVVYVVALTNTLIEVPCQILANNFGKILPLFLESLCQDSAMLLHIALAQLHNFLVRKEFNNELKDHIQSMLPRLLPLAHYEESMEVRRLALSCIYEMCKFPPELLLPFKIEVILKLQSCLGDPKRLVRRDAVKARSTWILLAAPGNNH